MLDKPLFSLKTSKANQENNNRPMGRKYKQVEDKTLKFIKLHHILRYLVIGKHMPFQNQNQCSVTTSKVMKLYRYITRLLCNSLARITIEL